ncbi:MAG: hypothetical protein U1D55_16065 [Phycisphaerae bacterium]
MGVWVQVANTGPSPRDAHAMAYDAAAQRVILFGGYAGGASSQNDTWTWNGINWTLLTTPVSPEPYFYHSLAYDSVHHTTVLYGAYPPPRQNTWELSGTTWSHSSSLGPSSRVGAAMAFDAERNEIVLFGGGSAAFPNPPLGDTWTWNGVTWSQKSVTAPPARVSPGMVFDSARGKIVLFGGATNDSGTTCYGDTWEWDGQQWTPIATSGPAPRLEPAMTYDSVVNRIVLFGGRVNNTTGYLGDTWELTGAAWTLVANTGPAGRGYHAMAFDASRGASVLFGGFNGTRLGDTWVWSYLPLFVAQPEGRTICPGGAASLAVALAPNGPFTYAWRRDAVPLDSSANPSAATPTLVLAPITIADAGAYDCVVSNGCGSRTSAAAVLSVCDHAGDTDCDGAVGPADLGIVLANWYLTVPAHSLGDLDGDGFVSEADLGILLGGWGAACP